MKKLKKAVLSMGFVGVGALLSNSHPVADAASLPAKNVVTVQKPIRGSFTGWEDPNFFEVKTSKGYMVFQTYNQWYFIHLKESHHYIFFYETNRYGQNIITKIDQLM